MNENGYYRDWRGFFVLSGLTQLEYGVISQCEDKTGNLLKLWVSKNIKNGFKTTVQQLMTVLEIIDRYDVLEYISSHLSMS